MKTLIPAREKGRMKSNTRKAAGKASLDPLVLRDSFANALFFSLCARGRKPEVIERKDVFVVGGKIEDHFSPAQNAEGQGCRASRHTLDPLVGASGSPKNS